MIENNLPTLVESRALAEINRALKITGHGGQVIFDEHHLQQTLVVNDLVRRAFAPVGTDHLWGVQLRNTHLAAEAQIITSFDPYALSVATVGNAWPDADTLEASDVWIFGPVSGSLASGAYLGAELDVLWGTTRVAQIDVSGALATPLAVFNDVTTVAGLRTYLRTPDNQVLVPGAWRIPRGVTVRFVTQTAPAAADIYCYFYVGIFRRGMGQDAQ